MTKSPLYNAGIAVLYIADNKEGAVKFFLKTVGFFAVLTSIVLLVSSLR